MINTMDYQWNNAPRIIYNNKVYIINLVDKCNRIWCFISCLHKVIKKKKGNLEHCLYHILCSV